MPEGFGFCYNAHYVVLINRRSGTGLISLELTDLLDSILLIDSFIKTYVECCKS